MVLTSPVEICNLALTFLKVPAITSIETPSNEIGRMCRLWYDESRRQALRLHPWNFAKSRAILNLDSTDPSFGYSDRYKLPNDFVRLRFIDDDNYGVVGIDFDIEGGYLLIDNGGATTLNIGYIKDEETVVKFDPLFIKAFALTLASNMCYGITGKTTLQTSINAQLLAIYQPAMAINGQDKPPVRVTKSRILGARRTYSTGGVSPTDPTLVPMN